MTAAERKAKSRAKLRAEMGEDAYKKKHAKDERIRVHKKAEKQKQIDALAKPRPDSPWLQSNQRLPFCRQETAHDVKTIRLLPKIFVPLTRVPGKSSIRLTRGPERASMRPTRSFESTAIERPFTNGVKPRYVIKTSRKAVTVKRFILQRLYALL